MLLTNVACSVDDVLRDARRVQLQRQPLGVGVNETPKQSQLARIS